MVCSEILYFLFFFPRCFVFVFWRGGCPCAILTDRLARVQLTGLGEGQQKLVTHILHKLKQQTLLGKVVLVCE